MAKPRKKTTKKAPAKRRPRKLVATPGIKAAAARSLKRAAKGAPIKKGAGIVRKPARKAPARLVLYGHFASAPSAKVGLMLAASGLEHDYRHVDLSTGAHRTPDYLAKNRFGQVPVLQHGEEYVVQSPVILRYLADLSGKFGGRNGVERRRIDEWLAFDLDQMAAGVGVARFLSRFQPDATAVIAAARQRGERGLATLDRQLGASKYLAGAQPTIADIAIFPWIAIAEEGGFDLKNHPNVQAWAERMLLLPGIAHPYAVMPKEDRVR